MKESTRIFRFMVVGTMNAVITAFVVWLIMKILSFENNYLIANVVAYLIAQFHNFLWCKNWIFPVKDGKNHLWKQMLFFCYAFGIAYSVQFLFLLLLVKGIGVNEYLAQFLGLFVYGSINFLINKRVTFQ